MTQPRTDPASDIQSQLDSLGIKTTTKAVYEWRSYRYSNASDAIAAAKRAAR